MKIIQIGANRGYDDLTNFISKNQVNFAIFVEPNPFHIKDLKKCYPNYIIENIAIKPNNEDKSEVDFYYYEKDLPNFEIASMSKEHVWKHYGQVELQKIIVPALTLEELFDKYEIKDLDWLLLDIEGFDAEIALNFNWDKYNIKKIDIEKLHLGDKTEEVIQLFLSKDYKESTPIDSHGYDISFTK